MQSIRPKIDTSLANQMHELCKMHEVEKAQTMYDIYKNDVSAKILSFDGHSDFINACIEGRIDMAKFLYDLFNLSRDNVLFDNNYAFRCACKNGFLLVAQWLHQICCFNDNELKIQNNYTLKWACINDHLHMIKWLLNICTYTEQEIKNAFYLLCLNNNLETTKWFYNTMQEILNKHIFNIECVDDMENETFEWLKTIKI